MVSRSSASTTSRYGTRKLTQAHATYHPSWAYLFTWRSSALQGQLGAGHVMESPFLSDQLRLPSLDGPRALLGDVDAPADLATPMRRAWIQFAATGDPGWPR